MNGPKELHQDLVKNNPRQKGWMASLILTSLFVALVSFPGISEGKFLELKSSIPYLLSLLFTGAILFLILKTGKMNRYRKIFFVTYALIFVVSFLMSSFITRGHMYATDRAALNSEIPICHIVIPTLIGPMLAKGELNFPGELDFSLGLTLLVLFLMVIYGRSFCSWGCFFGGQDELFANLGKRKKWNMDVMKGAVKYFPYAFLMALLLHSFSTMTASFCFYFCPFKATTEFPEITSGIRVFFTATFLFFMVAFIILLPLFTKKRSFCTLICPLGTTLNLFNKINLFDLKVNKSMCVNHMGVSQGQCNICIKVCPTASITHESIAQSKVLINCTKCSACVDECPTGALDLGIKGISFTMGTHPLKNAPSASFKRFVRDLWDPGLIFPMGLLASATLVFNSFVENIFGLLVIYV